MRLRPEQLQQHLDAGLAPVYVICGDEPLLVQESADSVRTTARAQGFTERELFHADTGFDWNQILSEANSLSLFATRKILEVRLPTGKPGDKGSKVFQEYCVNPNPDTLLLVVSGKLDNTALRSKWAKALDQAGVIVQVWPVAPGQMPRWIAGRLKQAGIRANNQAVEILADRVEGNLLAAVQEIEKLKLLVNEGEVDADTMSTVVADSARYNVFGLVDKILEGDAGAAARTLRGLRDEGTDATVILWALTRELRTLLKAREAVAGGDHMDWALKNLGVWEKRKPLVRNALRRLKPQHLRALLRQAGGIDRAIKGMRTASPWDELTSLTLSFAGSPSLSARSVRQALRD